VILKGLEECLEFEPVEFEDVVVVEHVGKILK
jgi:hypothetical protein